MEYKIQEKKPLKLIPLQPKLEELIIYLVNAFIIGNKVFFQ